MKVTCLAMLPNTGWLRVSAVLHMAYGTPHGSPPLPPPHILRSFCSDLALGGSGRADVTFDWWSSMGHR